VGELNGGSVPARNCTLSSKSPIAKATDFLFNTPPLGLAWRFSVRSRRGGFTTENTENTEKKQGLDLRFSMFSVISVVKFELP
jgi:hypothetical protein